MNFDTYFAEFAPNYFPKITSTRMDTEENDLLFSSRLTIQSQRTKEPTARVSTLGLDVENRVRLLSSRPNTLRTHGMSFEEAERKKAMRREELIKNHYGLNLDDSFKKFLDDFLRKESLESFLSKQYRWSKEHFETFYTPGGNVPEITIMDNEIRIKTYVLIRSSMEVLTRVIRIAHASTILNEILWNIRMQKAGIRVQKIYAFGLIDEPTRLLEDYLNVPYEIVNNNETIQKLFGIKAGIAPYGFTECEYIKDTLASRRLDSKKSGYPMKPMSLLEQYSFYYTKYQLATLLGVECWNLIDENIGFDFPGSDAPEVYKFIFSESSESNFRTIIQEDVFHSKRLLTQTIFLHTSHVCYLSEEVEKLWHSGKIITDHLKGLDFYCQSNRNQYDGINYITPSVKKSDSDSSLYLLLNDSVGRDVTHRIGGVISLENWIQIFLDLSTSTIPFSETIPPLEEVNNGSIELFVLDPYKFEKDVTVQHLTLNDLGISEDPKNWKSDIIDLFPPSDMSYDEKDVNTKWFKYLNLEISNIMNKKQERRILFTCNLLADIFGETFRFDWNYELPKSHLMRVQTYYDVYSFETMFFAEKDLKVYHTIEEDKKEYINWFKGYIFELYTDLFAKKLGLKWQDPEKARLEILRHDTFYEDHRNLFFNELLKKTFNREDVKRKFKNYFDEDALEYLFRLFDSLSQYRYVKKETKSKKKKVDEEDDGKSSGGTMKEMNENKPVSFFDDVEYSIMSDLKNEGSLVERYKIDSKERKEKKKEKRKRDSEEDDEKKNKYNARKEFPEAIYIIWAYKRYSQYWKKFGSHYTGEGAFLFGSLKIRAHIKEYWVRVCERMIQHYKEEYNDEKISVIVEPIVCEKRFLLFHEDTMEIADIRQMTLEKQKEIHFHDIYMEFIRTMVRLRLWLRELPTKQDPTFNWYTFGASALSVKHFNRMFKYILDAYYEHLSYEIFYENQFGNFLNGTFNLDLFLNEWFTNDTYVNLERKVWDNIRSEKPIPTGLSRVDCEVYLMMWNIVGMYVQKESEKLAYNSIDTEDILDLKDKEALTNLVQDLNSKKGSKKESKIENVPNGWAVVQYLLNLPTFPEDDDDDDSLSIMGTERRQELMKWVNENIYNGELNLILFSSYFRVIIDYILKKFGDKIFPEKLRKDSLSKFKVVLSLLSLDVSSDKKEIEGIMKEHFPTVYSNVTVKGKFFESLRSLKFDPNTSEISLEKYDLAPLRAVSKRLIKNLKYHTGLNSLFGEYNSLIEQSIRDLPIGGKSILRKFKKTFISQSILSEIQIRIYNVLYPKEGSKIKSTDLDAEELLGTRTSRILSKYDIRLYARKLFQSHLQSVNKWTDYILKGFGEILREGTIKDYNQILGKIGENELNENMDNLIEWYFNVAYFGKVVLTPLEDEHIKFVGDVDSLYTFGVPRSSSNCRYIYKNYQEQFKTNYNMIQYYCGVTIFDDKEYLFNYTLYKIWNTPFMRKLLEVFASENLITLQVEFPEWLPGWKANIKTKKLEIISIENMNDLFNPNQERLLIDLLEDDNFDSLWNRLDD